MNSALRDDTGWGLRVVVVAALVLVGVVTAFGSASSDQPEFRAAEQENQKCLKCHKTILDAQTLRPDVREAHRRHLESTIKEFGGRQRVCTTCHEAFVKGKVEGIEGAPVKGFFHPSTSNQPTKYWRLRVRKLEVPDTPAALPPIMPEDPQIFKPTLKRMVCLECHSRKLKVFYPPELK
jgi:nitrate reductase cytochrome c-type subunit